MTIFINGVARELRGDISVSSMLDELDLPRQRVAIELNRQVVRRQDWESTPVSDGDRIEVVTFVGGG